MTRHTLTALMVLAVLPAALGSAQDPQTPVTQEPAVQQQAPALTPTDPRLQQIVQLVKSGLSESLIAESIRKETVPYNLTPQDLLYLKENRIPESIIAALLAVEAPTSPGPGRQEAQRVAATPTPQPAAGNTIEGLVLQTGAFRKNRPGTVVFAGDKIEWRDGSDASYNAEIFPDGIRSVELKCRTTAGTPFCYQLEIDIAKGDTFSFEDVNKERGGNQNILALRDAFKAFYPRIPVVEKVRR